LLLIVSGCAHHVGRQSTSGALAELEAQVAPEPGQTPAEAVARRATNGVINELSEPEQKERMDAMMAGAADSFHGALTRGLTDDLGANGDGPLAQSFAALAERSAARAAHGAMTTMLAGCDPEDPTCLDRRVTDLSTRAAVAFVDGVKRSLGLTALAIAFGAGAASMLLLSALWRLTRRLSDSSGGRRRAERPTFDHPRPEATSTT
jgi:hypothetical protein